ncbi:unnamed protein product [Orchesella dallaii]|uniref:C2H2-type domain-containing protein n=1 Tax=Orchesella dallaii TaxID=48710 RepID=A0ABP1QAS1_9HEXA
METQQQPPSEACGGADPTIQHCRCCVYKIVKMDLRQAWESNEGIVSDENVPEVAKEVTIKVKTELLEDDVGFESGGAELISPDVMQQGYADPDGFLGDSEGEMFGLERIPFPNVYSTYGMNNINVNVFGDSNPDAGRSEGGIDLGRATSSFSSFTSFMGNENISWGTGTNQNGFSEASDKLDTEGLYSMMGTPGSPFTKKDVLLTEGILTTNDLDTTGNLVSSQPRHSEESEASTTIVEVERSSSIEPSPTSPPHITQQSQLKIDIDENLSENQAVAPSHPKNRVNSIVKVAERSSPRFSNGQRYNCKSCNKGFSSKVSLEAHQREHELGDEPKPFPCDICNRNYASKGSYKSHFKRHRTCAGCGMYLGNAPRVNTTGNRSENILCDNCKPVNDNLTSDVHQNGSSPSLNQKSSSLANGNGRSSIPRPRASIRQARMAQNSLEESSESTADEDDEDVKIGSKSFKCNVCPKVFVNQARFKSHMTSHDVKSTDPFVCSEPGCGAAFGSHHGLQNHRVKHMKNAFPCDKCDMKFKMKHHRKLHYSTHFKSPEFACKICGKEFGSVATLKTHQKKASVSCKRSNKR